MDSSDKKELPVSLATIKTSESKAKDIDITMIGTDAYCIAYCLKKAQVFAISMRDIQYQAEKEARAKTDPKSVVSQEYHDFLNVFSKKDSDILPPYRKYDHKIHQEEEQKPGHALLHKMFLEELDAVKRYFHSHLAKGFI